MRVVIDAFGGDNAPEEIVKGAAAASAELNVDITLTGNKNTIEKITKLLNLGLFGLKIELLKKTKNLHKFFFYLIGKFKL